MRIGPAANQAVDMDLRDRMLRVSEVVSGSSEARARFFENLEIVEKKKSVIFFRFRKNV
jgi:plasmid stabilization system protein ParE